MACTLIRAPDRPTVLHFQPYNGRARVCCSPFTVFNDEGTHIDTEIAIDRVDPFATVDQRTLGFGASNFTITGLSLQIATLYRCRVRNKNEVGFGKWSLPNAGLIPADLSLPEINVPIEPVPETALVIPITPTFQASTEELRPHVEWPTMTGDLVRRLQHTRPRRAAPIRWQHLKTAERDTLVAFLDARINAVEAFQTADPVHGDRLWFVREGRYSVIMDAPGTWTIEADADEVFTTRFWTVGKSKVGGSDKIR